MDTLPVVPPRLVFRANATAFAGGVIGAFFGTIAFYCARVSGFTAYNFEMNAGALLTNTHVAAVSPAAWTLGFVFKLIASGIIGWVYAGGFKLLGRAGWDIGAAFGVIHWIITGWVIGTLGATGHLVQDPGYYGVNFGWQTFVLLFFSHVIFGVIVGGLYLPARARVTSKEKYEYEKSHKKAA